MKPNNLQLYKSVQPFMKSGDLIEWGGTSILSRMIRWFTKKDVNHSSLLLRIDYVDLSDRRFVLEMLDDGLEFNLLSKRLEKYEGSVWWHALKPHFDGHRQRMSSWAIMRKAEKVGYDFNSLFANIFGKVSIDARRFFCSEYYHAALIYAGIAPPSEEALRPGEFESLKVHLPAVRIL